MERAKLILVASALNDRKGEQEAMTLLASKAKDGVRVVSALDGVNWDAVRAAEGGWEGAYRWAAETYDSICVVPVDGENGLSRGVFSMAQAALALGKPVLAVCGGALSQVARVFVTNTRDYKGVCGRFERVAATPQMGG